jgi:hypothetical protein
LILRRLLFSLLLQREQSVIRLTSAVAVLSADDPVRVFQEFATLDLISRGRAEIELIGKRVKPFLRSS